MNYFLFYFFEKKRKFFKKIQKKSRNIVFEKRILYKKRFFYIQSHFLSYLKKSFSFFKKNLVKKLKLLFETTFWKPFYDFFGL